MSKLQELIKELCPDGVEFRNLGDICEIYTGGEPPKDTIKGDNKDEKHVYPVWANGKEVYGYASTYKIDKDATVISSIGANTGSIYFRKAFFTPIIRLKVLVPKDNNLISKYLYYYLSTVTFVVKSSSVPNMNSNEVKKLEIPIPPLEVQNEIVRILDTFTSHTAELQAELQARKEQYEYYRNKLLTFDENDEGVNWMTFGEIGNICMCKRIMKHQTSDIGEVPFFKIGTFGKKADAFISYDLYDEYKNKYSFPRKGEILISASGTIGRTVIYDGQDAYFQDSNIIWIQNDESKVLNKYLYYYYQIIEWNVEGGTIKRLYNTNLSKTIIAYPSLSEQQRIVSILDKFESLVNDLTAGLPAEIAAVQEQYEYYRNKLLTFKRIS